MCVFFDGDVYATQRDGFSHSGQQTLGAPFKPSMPSSKASALSDPGGPIDGKYVLCWAAKNWRGGGIATRLICPFAFVLAITDELSLATTFCMASSLLRCSRLGGCAGAGEVVVVIVVPLSPLCRSHLINLRVPLYF